MKKVTQLIKEEAKLFTEHWKSTSLKSWPAFIEYKSISIEKLALVDDHIRQQANIHESVIIWDREKIDELVRKSKARKNLYDPYTIVTIVSFPLSIALILVEYINNQLTGRIDLFLVWIGFTLLMVVFPIAFFKRLNLGTQNHNVDISDFLTDLLTDKESQKWSDDDGVDASSHQAR